MSDRLEAVLELTARLSDLVTEEIRLLEAREPHKLSGHEDERTRLSMLYAREMQALKADRDAVRAAGDERLARLRDETAAFNEMLDRHRGLVARMRKVTEGIIRTIADEAAAQRAPVTTYGASGVAAPSGPASIALNKKV